MISSIILAGGRGKRLAPLSTEEKPKQFHDLTGIGISMYQQTLLRAQKVSKPSRIFTVANISHKNLVLSQAASANQEIAQNIIFETEARNTANAIILGVKKIKTELVAVFPSDHLIEGEFMADFECAKILATSGKIVTFGIKPESADSNFGYLYENSFYEKPDEYEAEKLVAGGALWNSGIFVFDASTLIDEIENLYGSLDDVPAISFDHAVMEKTDRLAVVAASFNWCDMGSWKAVEQIKNRMTA